MSYDDIPKPPKGWESNVQSMKNSGWYLTASLFALGFVIFFVAKSTGYRDIIMGLLVPVLFFTLGIIVLLYMLKTRKKPVDGWKRELPYSEELYRDFDEKFQTKLKDHNLSWRNYESDLIGSFGLTEVKTEEGTTKKFHQKYSVVNLNRENLRIEYGMFKILPGSDSEEKKFLIGMNNITPDNSEEALEIARKIEDFLDELEYEEQSTR